MTLPASIRVNVRASFPSIVTTTGFLSLSKANGVWTFGTNFRQLTAAPGNLATSPYIFPVQDPAIGAFYSVTLAAIVTAFAAALPATLPTSLPSAPGILWNNGGVVS